MTAYDDMPASQDTALIEKTKSYILQNYSKDIALETAASYVNLSPSYLSKLFKDEVGENFSNYLLNYRMHIARGLLKEGVYKANAVAQWSDFMTKSIFTRFLRKVPDIRPANIKIYNSPANSTFSF